MTPEELLDRIVAIFPGFRDAWESPRNNHRDDDGSFTLHGAFSEFTHYFEQHHASLSSEHVAEFAAFINTCMESNDELLDNAAATCFVEIIAGEDYARAIAPHLKGHALQYFERWGGVPIEVVALREFLRQRHPKR